MSKLPLDALGVSQMASGHICLNLTKRVDWEAFPSFAQTLASVIHANILKKTDAPDTRLWDLRVGNATAVLVFDDYPLMVSLEASDAHGDELVTRAHKQLADLR